jgi:hypothetical protein
MTSIGVQEWHVLQRNDGIECLFRIAKTVSKVALTVSQPFLIVIRAVHDHR